MRLPRLHIECYGITKSAQMAVEHINNIGVVLTCLACEAKKNELISMTYVLLELANELSGGVDAIDTFIKITEQKEKEKEKNEKNKKN